MQMNSTFKLCLRGALASALVLVSASSMAASTWNLDTCTNQTSAGGASGLGNKYYCAGTTAGNGVTVSAFGNNSTSTAYSAAFVKQNGAGVGLGVGSQAEGGNAVGYPEHAMDNNPGGMSDMILLQFDSAVALGTVKLGWTSSDADITVMAYMGGTAPAISGKTMSSLTASGTWGLIQNVGDGAPDSGYSDSGTDISRSVNAGYVVSSWWLVSAYNSGFGGTGITSPDSVKDIVKLMSVASKDVPPPPPGKTPEPASLALTSLALLGALGARRRHLRKEA